MLQVEPLAPNWEIRAALSPSWRITLQDGSAAIWEGFYVGPIVLSDSEVWEVSKRLLGMEKQQVETAARHELQPHTPAGPSEQALIMHSATPIKKCFEEDLDYVLRGMGVEEPTTYIETRSVYLASKGDIAVGRTQPWKAACAAAGIETIEVPGLHYYYLTHALLKLAETYAQHPSPALERIVTTLQSNPRCVVRLYSLDDEAQILLLWLKRVAGVERLRIEANGPEASTRWSQKAPLHPTVQAALGIRLPNAELDPLSLLRLESERTQLYQELGLLPLRLPGYTIEGVGVDMAEVEWQLATAAKLLADRYGLRLGCLKPAKGTGGARITTHVALNDIEALAKLAHSAMGSEDYILEAQADYLRHKITGHEFILAPSAHVLAGRVAPGATLQMMHGTVWQGNVYIDEHTCADMGVSVEQYQTIQQAMREFLAAFQGGGRDLGLVKGGVDFAVARVGGRFDDTVLIAMQDLNLSSFGAEYLRVFLDEARGALGSRQPVYAAAKVIHPASHAALEELQAATSQEDYQVRYARTIASVPGRWGLACMAADHPVPAAEDLLKLEQRLIDLNLALG